MTFRLGRVSVTVEFGLVALLTVYAMLGGGRLLMLSLAASAAHELGHLAALRLHRGTPDSIRLTMRGAVIHTGRPPDVLFALGGAAANLALALVCLPLGAHGLFAANAALGLVSLVPAYPLDGAQALGLLLDGHPRGGRVCTAISAASCTALAFWGTLVLLRSQGNFSLLFLALWLLAAILNKALDSAA